ncbi:maleate cis-trans isomerase family protein [Ancylobacter pratisalsi]|uniref:Asp/Glu racemase n=1 Tax=Ancylobacter pratisalsi TaxID=1745854 RepID=A0A6P1YNA3_9HYPH|nr:Asp/Glu racemase [Ancylobacter pratisalsi]QIB34809.1 Asp/Glu racemase [Ancylobacter pratisalsi]
MSLPTGAAARSGFQYDGYGTLGRLGLIYIASSIVMDAEWAAMAAPGLSIHTTRLRLPKVTLEGIDAMMTAPELEQSARLVGSAPIDVMCFGGTSASFVYGTDYDKALITRMENWSPGVKATTASTASLAALAKVNAGPVALATPYVDAIHQRAINFLESNGHKVLNSGNLGIDEDWALAQVPLEQVFDHVVACDHPEATAIFISCTNFRSSGVIEALERALGKPVISAVQASFWHCLEVTDIKGARPGYGQLFHDRLA